MLRPILEKNEFINISKSSLKVHQPTAYIPNALTHLPYCRIYALVNYVSIGSDNGLPPERRQTIIWSSADILSIIHQGIYFNDILFEIQICSFKKMRMNMSSAKRRPFCPGGDELKDHNDGNTIPP